MIASQIKIVQEIMNIVCENTEFPHVEVLFAEVRKDVLLVKTCVELPLLLNTLRKYENRQSNLKDEMFRVLDNALLCAIQPYIELEYKTAVVRNVFFTRTYSTRKSEGYFAIFFKKRVFDIQNCYAQEEDKAKREASKIWVEITQRKTNKNMVYFFPENKYLHVFRGLYSKYEQEYILDNPASEKITTEKVEYVYEKILKEYSLTKGINSKTFVNFDLTDNSVTGLIDTVD